MFQSFNFNIEDDIISQLDSYENQLKQGYQFSFAYDDNENIIDFNKNNDSIFDQNLISENTPDYTK